MIQFKRGKTNTWNNQKTLLADGQPGYDKDKKKLKIGDGKTAWKNLPFISGLFAEEILEKESKADDNTLFTYGTGAPKSSTKGKVYLQQFDGAVEKDFVVDIGRSVNYFYRKWNSGFIECWGKGNIPNNVEEKFTNIVFNVKTGDYFEVKGFWK
jgi:hypothetical protein